MKLPAPDFVVEVLSPTSEERDRGIKLEDYAEHGVTEYWIVDAEVEVVEQYVLDAGHYRLESRKGDGELRAVAIQALTIPVRAIFDTQANLETLQRILSEHRNS